MAEILPVVQIIGICRRLVRLVAPTTSDQHGDQIIGKARPCPRKIAPVEVNRCAANLIVPAGRVLAARGLNGGSECPHGDRETVRKLKPRWDPTGSLLAGQPQPKPGQVWQVEWPPSLSPPERNMAQRICAGVWHALAGFRVNVKEIFSVRCTATAYAVTEQNEGPRHL